MRRACFLSMVAFGACAGSPPEPTRSRDPDAGQRHSEREAAAVGARGSDAPLDGPPVHKTSASSEGGGSDFQLAAGEFSGLVAGVPLWMDIGTTARGCDGPRSEFLVADSEARQVRPEDAVPGDLMVCVNPPVDPFSTHNVTQSVMLPLCESPLGLVGCSGLLSFKKDDFPSAIELLKQVTGKYGKGTSSDPPFSCSGPEGDRQFKRVWYVPLSLENGDRFVYRIVLGWTCEPATGAEAPGILFVYQTPTEIERRLEENRARRESF